MKKIAIAISFIALLANSVFATHNLSGEITYKWISGTTYDITVTTYTKESSQADRCTLTIYFGDGDSCVAGRNNGPLTATTSSGYHLDCTPFGTGEVLKNDIKKNIYTCTHTYLGAGSYWISMEDPNRNGGISNIPNSINTAFSLRCGLVINNFIGSHNSSPVLLNPPVDNGCTSKCFYHNVGAYDPDGDSLSYRLDTCLGNGGMKIPGWTTPPTTSTYSLNPLNGDFVWCTPSVVGQFNIVIAIDEWRNGYLIGSVSRDMQINIAACSNNTPTISNVSDTSVIAGHTISLLAKANDTDGDNVTLSAVSETLTTGATNPLATFPTAFGGSKTSSTFTWSPVSGQVRSLPYVVYFKASDDGAVTPLAAYKTVNIKVLPFPAGINETSTTLPLAAYPNPFQSTVQLSIPPKAGELRVFNMLGETVYNELLSNSAAGETKIDLSSLSNGLYQISFSTTTGTYSTRLIKN